MPKAWTSKEERQYKHIKQSELSRGRTSKRAAAIAGATVNKGRRQRGETPNKTSQGTGNPNSGLNERTVGELRRLAASRDVKGRSRMSKSELVTALRRGRKS